LFIRGILILRENKKYLTLKDELLNAICAFEVYKAQAKDAKAYNIQAVKDWQSK